MSRSQEKLLIATLAGLVIAGAAAFVVAPTLAATPGYASAPVASWDHTQLIATAIAEN